MTMKKLVTWFLAYTLAALMLARMMACEGEVEGHGFVVDKSTGDPLDSVRVRYYTEKRKRYFDSETYTDDNGYFNVGSFEGCVPDCPDVIVELIKDGYQTVEVKNPAGDTIYLEH